MYKIMSTQTTLNTFIFSEILTRVKLLLLSNCDIRTSKKLLHHRAMVYGLIWIIYEWICSTSNFLTIHTKLFILPNELLVANFIIIIMHIAILYFHRKLRRFLDRLKSVFFFKIKYECLCSFVHIYFNNCTLN